MLEKIKELLNKRGTVDKSLLPKHIAITMHGNLRWSKKNNKSIEESYNLAFKKLEEMIKYMTEIDVPIVTFHILRKDIKKETDLFLAMVDELSEFFNEFAKSPLLHENKIKVSILGKWYELPSKLVDSIKNLISETSDYDNFFVNFCINYSGQEEILDACKLIARQVSLEKIDPEKVDSELIKENLYSSYFLPPDLIVKTGFKKETSGILLWDSSHAKIFFSEKLWNEMTNDDISKGIDLYKVHKQKT